MKKMSAGIIKFGAVVALAFSAVWAQAETAVEAELAQLKRDFAGEIFMVKSGVDALEWTGVSDLSLFDPIAERLEKNLVNQSKDAQEMNAWLIKALGLSGQEKYLPLLDKLIQDKDAKKLVRHATVARERLPLFKTYNPLISRDTASITTTDALKRQRVINMFNSDNAVLIEQGARRVYERYPHDEELLGLVHKSLLKSYKTAQSVEETDTAAWLCKTLGQSRKAEYKAILETIANDPDVAKNIVKYAKKALETIGQQ